MVYSGNQEIDAFRYKKSREFDIKMAEDGYENPFWRDHELFRRFNKEKNPHAINLGEDYFVIYPYRAGIPFLFEYIEN